LNKRFLSVVDLRKSQQKQRQQQHRQQQLENGKLMGGNLCAFGKSSV